MIIRGYSKLSIDTNSPFNKRETFDIFRKGGSFVYADDFSIYFLDKRKIKKILKNKLYYINWKEIINNMKHCMYNTFLTSEMAYIAQLEVDTIV